MAPLGGVRGMNGASSNHVTNSSQRNHSFTRKYAHLGFGDASLLSLGHVPNPYAKPRNVGFVTTPPSGSLGSCYFYL